MLGYNVIDVSSYIIEYSNKINSPVSEYSTYSEPHRPALRATHSII